MQPPIIDVRDLHKRFGPVEAVRGVTFSVAAGEIFGFLGPNGAGKTTTIRRRALVATYSGGMKRRLEITWGLLHKPRVLFLDEPTLGLDLQTRNRIWEYVVDLRRREGVTVFMTTHYIEESEHCDRIAIIDGGRIAALDTPEALRRQVGGDVITITSPDAPSLAREIEAKFGAGARATDGRVIVEQERGTEFVPRVAAAFPRLVTAVAVKQPTLDDVFLKLTGHEIREESASATDQLRTMARAWGRR